MNTGAQFSGRTPSRHAPLAVATAALMLASGGCNHKPGLQSEPASPDAAAPVATVTPRAATGEVPAELLKSIIDDAVAREGLRREDIEVERGEAVIWPDGAFGCPEPGVMYTQAQIPGYWVVLRVGQQRYDYRASGKGSFRRCKGSFRLQLPVG